MCNHFCARSALVRKAELYQLLLDARGSDLMPVTPTTHVFCYNECLTAADEAVLTELLCERSCCTDSEADAAHCDLKLESRRNQTDGKLWLLKAGNSSNGNGIHMVSRFDQLASLLKAEQPRGCWCVQEFLSDAALVHGCRYSVRLLLLIASSQVGQPVFCCSFDCISSICRRSTALALVHGHSAALLYCAALCPSYTRSTNASEAAFVAFAAAEYLAFISVCTRTLLSIKCRYLSNSQGDSDVIRDCAFLFENLPALAAAGAATSFDVDECMRLMCEHARAAVSAAVATMIPVPRCFEFFAADFIVDSSGRPWLLEACVAAAALGSGHSSYCIFRSMPTQAGRFGSMSRLCCRSALAVLIQFSHVMRYRTPGVRICCNSPGKGRFQLRRCWERRLSCAIILALR